MPNQTNSGTGTQMTEREALRFIARFMQGSAALDALKPSRWAAFLDDMRDYLQVEGDGPVETTLKAAEADRQLVLKALEKVRPLVEAVVRREKSPEMRYGGGYLVVDATPGKKAPIALYGDEFADVLLQAVADDLTESEARLLGKCEKCTAIFLGNRDGQRFCSRRCANATAVARWRASQKATTVSTPNKPRRRRPATRRSR